MRLIPTVGDYLPLLVVAFLVAALLSLVLTPLVRRVAIRLGNVDHPEAPARQQGTRSRAAAAWRSRSRSSLVALGGIWLNGQTGDVPDAARRSSRRSWSASWPAALSATVLGFLDDTLPAPRPLAVAGPARRSPLLAVACRHHGQLHRTTRSVPGIIVLTGPFAIGFTMLWIVGMINSINFIDGLDGLSTGIALIAAVTLGLISLTTADQPAVRRHPVLRAWPARCSGSCAGTSTRRRSSSGPAA